MAGCGDRLDLEKQSISLVYGFDKKNNEKMVVYYIHPIFNQDIKKKYEATETTANTPREAKGLFNSSSNSLVSTEKLQIILFSRDFLKQEGAFPYLDVWYRDPKNTGNTRIVAVDGPVSSIVYNNFQDKPALPEYLTDLINTNKLYNRTVFTTFHDYHRQTFNKGMTPTISEIKKGEKDIIVTGSALLNDRGNYKMSLDRSESLLLLILQNKIYTPVSFTMKIPVNSVGKASSIKNKKGENYITINIQSIKQKIKTHYTDKHFIFDITIELKISISELTFDMSVEKERDKLSAIITKKLNKDLNNLICKVQRENLDPFGFGDNARAYHYKEWKRVQDDWPRAFSKAKVKVTPNIKIIESGIIN